MKTSFKKQILNWFKIYMKILYFQTNRVYNRNGNMTTEYVRKTVKINEDLWNKFQQKIEETYGTTYKHTSEELEKAIENYVTEDVYDVEITKTKINNLNDENKSLKTENEKLYNDLEKANNELDDLKKEQKEDNQKVKQQESMINNLKNENNRLKDSNEQLNKNIKRLENDNETQKKNIERLSNENQTLEEKYINQVEETNKQVQENTKIKNKREHAQERLNKTQDELNDTLKRLEKYSYAMGQVKNMSFIDRLFNRLPEEIKQLQPAYEDNKNEEK